LLVSKEYFWLLVAFVLVITVANVVTPMFQSTAERKDLPLTELTPGQADGALQLVDQGFGQEETPGTTSSVRVGYAFLVRNSDAKRALQSSAYRVVARDAENNVLASDGGSIVLVMPGQTLGIGGTLFVTESARVANLSVQLRAGELAAVRSSPFLSVEHVRYDAAPDATVSGVINNPFERDITDLRVSAVAYDADDRIVGGGFALLAFIPANRSLGVITSLNRASNVARVELYPDFSDQSSVTWPNEGLPPGGRALVLGQQGFGQRDDQLGYAFLLENPNDTLVVREIYYHVTAYSAAGEVLATDAGRLEIVLPGEKLGIGGSLPLEGEERIARVEALVLPRKYQLSASVPPFRVVDAVYQDDEAQPRATGRLINPYPQRVMQLHLSAVAYDAVGNIIGGGHTALEAVPAQGEVTAEVPIVVSAAPARVEIYATRTALTKME